MRRLELDKPASATSIRDPELEQTEKWISAATLHSRVVLPAKYLYLKNELAFSLVKQQDWPARYEVWPGVEGIERVNKVRLAAFTLEMCVGLGIVDI